MTPLFARLHSKVKTSAQPSNIYMHTYYLPLLQNRKLYKKLKLTCAKGGASEWAVVLTVLAVLSRHVRGVVGVIGHKIYVCHGELKCVKTH